MARTGSVTGYLGKAAGSNFDSYGYGIGGQQTFCTVATSNDYTVTHESNKNFITNTKLKLPDNAYPTYIAIGNLYAKYYSPESSLYIDTYLSLNAASGTHTGAYDVQIYPHTRLWGTSRTLFSNNGVILDGLTDYTGQYVNFYLTRSYGDNGIGWYFGTDGNGTSVIINYTYLTGEINVDHTTGGSILIQDSNNQTITTPVELTAGQFIYVTATPDTGRSLREVRSTVPDAVTLVSGNKYKITMPSSPEDINVIFNFRPGVPVGEIITKADMDTLRTYLMEIY